MDNFSLEEVQAITDIARKKNEEEFVAETEEKIQKIKETIIQTAGTGKSECEVLLNSSDYATSMAIEYFRKLNFQITTKTLTKDIVTIKEHGRMTLDCLIKATISWESLEDTGTNLYKSAGHSSCLKDYRLL